MAYDGRIETGTTRSGIISYQGEYDSFVSTFISGLTYSVSAKGASSGNGSLGDPNLSLYDANGTRLLYNDDIVQGQNRDAQLTFTIAPNGTSNYVLQVGETGNNATGSYQLTVSAGYASNAADRVVGTSYNDAINGMAGNDTIYGQGGNDVLFGGEGHDQLLGGDGVDVLQGQNGNDALRGMNGNDVLYGAVGADKLYGGTGADTFVFNSHLDSNQTYGVDTIAAADGAIAMEGVGVAGGDRIDLRGMDANVNVAGNQAFVFSASGAAGTCYLSEWNGNTVLNAHVNGDRIIDFQLVIADGAITAYQYTADEFLL